MQFKDIVGQSALKRGLLEMWHRSKLPHALLLLGREGMGGLPMAIALAQYVLCNNKQPDDSCGVCANCHKITRLEHADLHFSYPAISPKSGNKPLSKYYAQAFREFVTKTPYGTTFGWLQSINAENKQGNIPAEECREIIEGLNLKSYEGGFKIQIIWRPEYLGKEGNILLKLIEEPPEDTLLLFVAEERDEILPTILSRTQIIRLNPISPAEISAALTERVLTNHKTAITIGILADGSFTEALRLIKELDNELFPEVKRWFNALFRNNGIELTKITDDWSKMGREQQKNLLSYVIYLLGHAFRKKFNTHLYEGESEEFDFIKKLSTRQDTTPQFVNKMVETITRYQYNIERNGHAKTQLLSLSLEMHYIIANKNLPLLIV